MTLPINYKLPELNKYDSPEKLTSYLHDLIFELQNMYEKTAYNVNGSFRNNDDLDGSQYLPTMLGAGVAGTFTYSRQSSYVLRQGLMVDVWYDVTWTASGGAGGAMRLVLPYKVTKKAQMNFVGSCFINNATFAAGRTAAVSAAIPDTYSLSFQVYGTGTTTAPLSITGSGRVSGHLRYIGIEDE